MALNAFCDKTLQIDKEIFSKKLKCVYHCNFMYIKKVVKRNKDIDRQPRAFHSIQVLEINMIHTKILAGPIR